MAENIARRTLFEALRFHHLRLKKEELEILADYTSTITPEVRKDIIKFLHFLKKGDVLIQLAGSSIYQKAAVSFLFEVVTQHFKEPLNLPQLLQLIKILSGLIIQQDRMQKEFSASGINLQINFQGIRPYLNKGEGAIHLVPTTEKLASTTPEELKIIDDMGRRQSLKDIPNVTIPPEIKTPKSFKNLTKGEVKTFKDKMKAKIKAKLEEKMEEKVRTLAEKRAKALVKTLVEEKAKALLTEKEKDMFPSAYAENKSSAYAENKSSAYAENKSSAYAENKSLTGVEDKKSKNMFIIIDEEEQKSDLTNIATSTSVEDLSSYKENGLSFGAGNNTRMFTLIDNEDNNS